MNVYAWLLDEHGRSTGSRQPVDFSPPYYDDGKFVVYNVQLVAFPRVREALTVVGYALGSVTGREVIRGYFEETGIIRLLPGDRCEFPVGNLRIDVR